MRFINCLSKLSVHPPKLCKYFSVGNVKRPPDVRTGWGKEVLKDLVSLTAELIQTQGRAFESIAVNYCVRNNDVGTVTSRKISDSWLEIILPLADHQDLRKSLARSDGQTIRYGKLFEILDALAADTAYRHCGSGHIIVTASVDGVRASNDINLFHDVKLQAYMTYVGKSSMEVNIDIISSISGGKETIVGNTLFIMVARDRETNQSATVPALLLETENDKKRYEIGKQRASFRKERALQSLTFTAPKPEEIDIIHTLYLESIEMERAYYHLSMKDWLDHSSSSSSSSNSTSTNTTAAIDDQTSVNTDSILSNSVLITPTSSATTTTTTTTTTPVSSSSLSHPVSSTVTSDNSHTISAAATSSTSSSCSSSSTVSLIPPPQYVHGRFVHHKIGIKFMKDTIFKNTLLMHSQDRNLHGKIFGGFLMRVAFELAHVTACCYFGYDSPLFIAVDEVQFVKSVNMGTIMELKAVVVYQEDNQIVVKVTAKHIINYPIPNRIKTNTFVYLFKSPPEWAHVPKLIPQEYKEFVLYLEGKRSLNKLCQMDTITT